MNYKLNFTERIVFKRGDTDSRGLIMSSVVYIPPDTIITTSNVVTEMNVFSLRKGEMKKRLKFTQPIPKITVLGRDRDVLLCINMQPRASDRPVPQYILGRRRNTEQYNGEVLENLGKFTLVSLKNDEFKVIQDVNFDPVSDCIYGHALINDDLMLLCLSGQTNNMKMYSFKERKIVKSLRDQRPSNNTTVVLSKSRKTSFFVNNGRYEIQGQNSTTSSIQICHHDFETDTHLGHFSTPKKLTNNMGSVWGVGTFMKNGKEILLTHSTTPEYSKILLIFSVEKYQLLRVMKTKYEHRRFICINAEYIISGGFPGSLAVFDIRDDSIENIKVMEAKKVFRGGVRGMIFIENNNIKDKVTDMKNEVNLVLCSNEGISKWITISGLHITRMDEGDEDSQERIQWLMGNMELVYYENEEIRRNCIQLSVGQLLKFENIPKSLMLYKK